MEKALIISKFREPVGWISEFIPGWKVYVYSKDPKEPSPFYLKLPNIGLESHTYLSFIVDYYASLPEYCLFAQGNPFEHCRRFLVHALTPKVFPGFFALGDQTIVFNRYGHPQLWNYPPVVNGMSFSQFFEHLFHYPCPPILCCRPNGIFGVHRSRILAHPREFYEYLLQFLSQPNGSSTEGHFLERLWHVIFECTPFKEFFERLSLSHEERIHINQLIDRSLSLEAQGDIKCAHLELVTIETILRKVPSL